MKDSAFIRESLGLTQKELALLLGVTRSQIAMYESSQRRLPTKANIKFAELAVLLHEKTNVEKKAPRPDTPLKPLESRLREVDYQILKWSRRYEALKLQIENSSRRVRFAYDISQKQEDNPATQLFRLLVSTAPKKLQDQSAALKSLEIKIKVLEFEKQLLEEELKKSG